MYYNYLSSNDYIGWLRSTVVERRYLTGELSLSCAWPAADGWPLRCVNRPLHANQLGQLNLSSFRGRVAKLLSDEFYLALMEPSGECLQGKGPPDRIRCLFLAIYTLWAKPGCCCCPAWQSVCRVIVAVRGRLLYIVYPV